MIHVCSLSRLQQTVEDTGALSAFPGFVAAKAATAPLATAFGTGILVALAGNLVNNLPMGLFAGAAGAVLLNARQRRRARSSRRELEAA